VVEVTRGEPRVESVTRLPVTPADDKAIALRIVAGGRADYVVSSLDPAKSFVAADGDVKIEFQGRFGWLSMAEGRTDVSRLVGGGRLRCGVHQMISPGNLKGTIVATDVEKNRLRVRFDGNVAPEAGQLMFVHNPGFVCPSVYRISFVMRESDGACAVSLSGMSLVVGRGRIAAMDEKSGSFSSATPLLKLRFNAGIFNGRRVRPADQNSAPEFKLTSATEAAFKLEDPAGLKSFRVGGEYVVFDVGAGDEVEIVSAGEGRIIVR
jgi:hypothetical protein